VDNYTTDGVLYSRLSLYELSFEDDSGNYTNIVSNQCGTSSVFGYIDVNNGRLKSPFPRVIFKVHKTELMKHGCEVIIDYKLYS